MKSKISFFNKTIFLKNVTLYWPIWGIYTFIAFLMNPAMLWLCNNLVFWNDEYTDTEQFIDLMFRLEFEGYVQLIAVGALFAGMALYSYMYNSKSANMIHSFPVDRTQLFGTTVISGWAFLIVPLFGAALLSTILCLVYTIPGIGYIWLWFLVVAALAIIAFSIVSICALFTGHIVVLPMYVIAVNLFSWIVFWLIHVVATTFGFGVTELGSKAEEIAGVFCPVECFYENLTWIREYTDSGELREVSLEGIPFIWLYLVLAVIFYVSAYVIYRKRKIEQAGDFLTVNWVKPIFRGVIGIFGSIFGAMLVREVLIDTEIGCGMFGFIITMLLIGAICYFAADMFIKKSFHVFKKRNWIGCGIFSVVLLVVFLSMYGITEWYEDDVPELAEIESAELHMSYEITKYGEDAATILEIHKDILEKAEYVEKMVESGERYYNGIRVNYSLKNGESVTRRYYLPMEDEVILPIYQKILMLEADEENYIINTFGKDYENISVFYGATVEAFYIEPEEREKIEKEKEDYYPDSNYKSKDMNEAQAKEMFEAILADIKAGTLMKYNVYTDTMMQAEKYDVDYFKGSDASILISYQSPEESSKVTTEDEDSTYIVYENEVMDAEIASDKEYMDYHHQRSGYLNFGPDCKNIVNKLIEFGIITSVEDIYWGEAEELLK